jgi:hypothetical protein
VSELAYTLQDRLALNRKRPKTQDWSLKPFLPVDERLHQRQPGWPQSHLSSTMSAFIWQFLLQYLPHSPPFST